MSIGSGQTPLPQRVLGRDLFWYLQTTRLIYKDRSSRIGQRMAGRDTLIGTNPRTLRRRHGVQIHGRAAGAAGCTLTFEDGSQIDIDAVIWATDSASTTRGSTCRCSTTSAGCFTGVA